MKSHKKVVVIYTAIICTFIFLSLSLLPRATVNSKSRRITVIPSPSFTNVSQRWRELRHLIIVPGHAIQYCTDIKREVYNEDCWFLYSYQKGQVRSFIDHIQQAVKIAKNDNNSLLVFSGGQTRSGMGPRSEAYSYFAVAESLGILGNSIFDRTITEEFASDSLENLLFSVCRFRQVTGTLPEHVTVVGFPFKERRFTELHRKAVGIPEEKFHYIGVNSDGVNLDKIIDDAYFDFKGDFFGCGEKLKGKRESRNPYKINHGYFGTCPELKDKLLSCSNQ